MTRAPPSTAVRTRSAATAAHVAALAVAAVILVAECDRQWFIGDEWSFLMHSSISVDGLFKPHNEHWSTVPVVIWRSLFALVGVSHYVLYAAPMIAAHLALTHVLWRLVQRLGAGAWVATGCCAVFSVLGAGYENTTWAFQLGFVGSVLFGLLAVASVDRLVGAPPFGSRRIWAYLVASLACSNIGVPMVVAAGLVALAHRRVRWAAEIVSVPALVWIAWYAWIGHRGATSQRPSAGQLAADLPGYIVNGLVTTLRHSLGGGGATAVVVLLVLVVWLVARGRTHRTAAALAASSVLLYASTGYGRLQYGSDQAAASRYSYVAVALLLPVVGIIVTQLVRGRRAVGAVAALATVALLAYNVRTLHDNGSARAVQTTGDREQIQATVALIRAGRPLPSGTEVTTFERITTSDLRGLDARGQIDAGSPDARVVATQLQLLTTTNTRGPRYSGPVVFGTSPELPACQPVEPFDYLPVVVDADGVSIRVRSAARTPVRVIVQDETYPRMVTTSVAAGTSWLNVPPGPNTTVYVSGIEIAIELCEE